MKRIGEEGFSLIQVLVAMGVAGMVSLGVATLLKSIFDVQRRSGVVHALQTKMMNYHIALVATAGRMATTNHAENDTILRCVRQSSTFDCEADLDEENPNPASWSTFLEVVATASGSGILYNRNGVDGGGAPSGSNGMRWDGSDCITAANGVGDATCEIPISFHVYQVSCASGDDCPGADIVIESSIGAIYYHPGAQYPQINFANYAFKVLWEGEFSITKLCESLNGTWDSITNVCSYNDGSNPCQAAGGEAAIMIGLNENYQPICTSKMCKPGQYVQTTQNISLASGSVVSAPVCYDFGSGPAGFTPPTVDDVCPAGQRLTGVKRNPSSVNGGAVEKICEQVIEPNGSGLNECPAGQAPTGFTLVGNRWRVNGCTAYHRGVRSCGVNQVVSTISTDGSVTCVPKVAGGSCGANQYVSGINADGTPQCANKNTPTLSCSWTSTYAENFSPCYGACPNTRTITTPACAAGSLAVGAEGWCQDYDPDAPSGWPLVDYSLSRIGPVDEVRFAIECIRRDDTFGGSPGVRILGRTRCCSVNPG